MKYASRKSIAVMMGGIIGRRVSRPDVDILVPIPLHKGSEREYNQTELIASGASAVWGIPVADCLRWRLDTPRQALSGSDGDRRLPLDAMAAARGLRGYRAMLVDDVCTSGNTLTAAAFALERAGALASEAVTWGRGG